jgi:hypothetical protein
VQAGIQHVIANVAIGAHMVSNMLPVETHPSMAQRQQRELQLVHDLQRELKAVQDASNHKSSSCMEQVSASQIVEHETTKTKEPMAIMGITVPVHIVVDESIPREKSTVEMVGMEEVLEIQEVR